MTAEDLDLINSRYQPPLARAPQHPTSHHPAPQHPTPHHPGLTLTTTNKMADAISRAKMSQLSGKEFVFPAIIQGKIEPPAYPADQFLTLKPGARVMLLKNDPQKRWVNGTMGIVSQINDAGISVEINGSSYPLERATWEVIEYRYHPAGNNIRAMVAGSFSQFPVKAAWAITIHKSQGLTFDRITVDLGAGAFAHGQTYTALSRCTSLDGLVLTKPVRRKDIILDDKVKNFIRAQKDFIPPSGS